MFTYDLMESMRNTSQWLGASARALGAYPAMATTGLAWSDWIRAWGEVTERSFARMVVKPDWGISAVTGDDGRDHLVRIETVVAKPFGELIHFRVPGRLPRPRRILLVAPMSGHYATLLRKTVISLLPEAEVFVTDWRNARDIPVSEGKFDIEDYTLYVAEFIRRLGPDLHVMAICQPAPLVLAATAILAEEAPACQPRTLFLVGGPVDPDANPTDVTDFGRRMTMGVLEHLVIQQVGFKYRGVGRMVYPGMLQLASFMSMNAPTHSEAFVTQLFRAAKGEASDHDKHNVFYDEYLAVMDMTAEFYLATVERIFKAREIALNAFRVGGRPVDLGRIDRPAVMVIEGEEDDISAPGQCLAALDLLTGLSPSRKAAHLEPGAGHYGIFAGKSWRNNIRPLVLSFIDAQMPPPPGPGGAAPGRRRGGLEFARPAQGGGRERGRLRAAERVAGQEMRPGVVAGPAPQRQAAGLAAPAPHRRRRQRRIDDHVVVRIGEEAGGAHRLEIGSPHGADGGPERPIGLERVARRPRARGRGRGRRIGQATKDQRRPVAPEGPMAQEGRVERGLEMAQPDAEIGRQQHRPLGRRPLGQGQRDERRPGRAGDDQEPPAEGAADRQRLGRVGAPFGEGGCGQRRPVGAVPRQAGAEEIGAQAVGDAFGIGRDLAPAGREAMHIDDRPVGRPPPRPGPGDAGLAVGAQLRHRRLARREPVVELGERRQGGGHDSSSTAAASSRRQRGVEKRWSASLTIVSRMSGPLA
jgi:poly(3-hydroxybutyrate) depolymerase